MKRRWFSFTTAIGLGLASVPAPSLAQQSGILPSDPQDFQCFVLLQQRRAVFLANQQLPVDQKAGFVNNLTIISAFYAGRISHYSSTEAVSSFAAANTEVNAASPEQRDAFANICANFYFRVMDLLVTSSQQTSPASQE